MESTPVQSPGAGGGGAEVTMVTSSTETEVFDPTRGA